MTRARLLACAVVLQLLVLAGEYLGSVWPAWTGERIALAVVPIDPRSWFAGNYARLDYEISRLPAELYQGDEPSLREGEVVYVALEPSGDLWQARAVTLEPPASGVFLRGRLRSPWYRDAELWIRYGIEAWFAPEEEALAIERSVVERGRDETRPVRAEIAVTDSGRAALVGLDWK